MRIAVVGPTIGGQLGRLLAHAGHKVVFAGRDPEKAAHAAATAGSGARSADIPQAVAAADVVVLAVPFDRYRDVAHEAGDTLRGKVIVDTSNPVVVRDGKPKWIDIPVTLTAAQYQQLTLGDVRLVKAFNLICGSHDLAELAQRSSGNRVAVMYVGDDPDAKQALATLIRDLNFVTIDVGTLADAGTIEPTPDTTWVPLTLDETRRYLNDRGLSAGQQP